MTKVIADITMSLDGFVTGPKAGPEAGLGDDGMPLHDWVFNGHAVDEAVLADATQRSGAVVMGRNLFDVVDGPDGWSDEIGYGAHNVGRPPFFVVTHNPPAQVRLSLDFTFVTDGVARCRRGARRVPARQRRRDHGWRQCDRAGHRRRSRRRDGAACVANRDGRRNSAVGWRRAAPGTPERCPGIAVRDAHHLRTQRERQERWLTSACANPDGVINAR
jgi:dihydrofolate reductase